jgi:hypothetical protein
MDKKEIDQLLLNQIFHKLNLSLKWLSEDMKDLNDVVNKATLCFADFSESYKKIKK